MIDWDKSAEEYDMSVKELQTYFKRKPTTHDKVCRVCDGCGKEKWIEFKSYRDLCVSCTTKKRFKNPDFIKKLELDLPIEQIGKEYLAGMNTVELGKKYGCNPQTINKRLIKIGIDIRSISDAKLKFYESHPEAREEASERTTKYFEEPKNCELYSESQKKRFEDIEERENARERTSKFFEDNLEARILASCRSLDINIEEWPGFTDKSRPHLTPISACIQLNQRFSGSEGHHIMTSVVIFTPKNLHRSIRHNFKTGVGMDEINKLAFDFLLGTQW